MTKFKIYYSASGLHPTEHPLPPHLIDHHFSCLAADINRHLSVKGIFSQVKIVSDLEKKYAEVSLDDKGQNLDLTTTLANCIGTINMATPSLCFIMDAINPTEHDKAS
jgi:hypothetical protein